MGLIINSVLSGVVDRIAKQAGLIKTGINNAVATGTPLYQRIHTGVGGNGDFNVEDDLIESAHEVDVNTFSGTLFRTVYNNIINDIDSHVTGEGAPTFDSFLNISGLNVHPDYDDVYFRVKGVHLDARNVMFVDSETILAGSYFPTGSGTGVFSAGTTIGTGTGKVTPTNHAAAKMVLVPVHDTTAAIQLNVRLTREQPTDGNQAAFDNILVANSTLSGKQYPISVDAGNIASGFLSVSNIVAAGGASGNGFRVYAIREREIAL